MLYSHNLYFSYAITRSAETFLFNKNSFKISRAKNLLLDRSFLIRLLHGCVLYFGEKLSVIAVSGESYIEVLGSCGLQ